MIHFLFKVDFVFECAVDTGGPRREFFRLLAMEISDGMYFQARRRGSFYVCNTAAYEVRSKFVLLIFECLIYFLQKGY